MPTETDPPEPEQQTYTVSREYPAAWSRTLCALALAWELLDQIDLRSIRHHDAVRKSIWPARRTARTAYRAMLEVDE